MIIYRTTHYLLQINSLKFLPRSIFEIDSSLVMSLVHCIDKLDLSEAVLYESWLCDWLSTLTKQFFHLAPLELGHKH